MRPDERWTMVHGLRIRVGSADRRPPSGAAVSVPLRGDDADLTAQVIGSPVPILDQDTEQFWWDAAELPSTSARAARIGSGYAWRFAYARSMPATPPALRMRRPIDQWQLTDRAA